ncbi:hypothetical protein DMZ43_12635 [Meridianimaribacter sp. CL38]|jgi:hypothetical protein|uniref:hypothetical protein n=1 Tax=Meridianimaribacter sp. CL38 TaxID=2213021 RepID=UPI00103F7E2B|nr:hypothetical protein [Meridianimaribacter sp. CL38]TBV25152.1 hypothetical protein DMZ43_12635 [Meridianimaribacter sp. CL38]
MKKIGFLFIVFLSINSFSQNLTCKDFKEGTFFVPSDSETLVSYKIIRNGNSQVEIVTDPEFEQTIYVIIEWIDDCSYRSFYDTEKMTLNDYQKFINENGGILTELKEIKGKCFFFKSTLSANDDIQVINGKFCSE